MDCPSIETAISNGAKFRAGTLSIRRSSGGKLLLFGDDPEQPHLTVYWRADTGELDVHVTKRGRGGRVSHAPVFRISAEGLVRVLVEVAQHSVGIMRAAVRNLEIDFLSRRHIVVVAGVYPQGAELDHLCTWRDRGTLELNQDGFRRGVWALSDPTDLRDAQDGLYDLREVYGKRSKSIGVAIKGLDVAGQRRLAWLKWSRLQDAMRDLQGLYTQAFGRHASVLGEMWPASANEN